MKCKKFIIVFSKKNRISDDAWILHVPFTQLDHLTAITQEKKFKELKEQIWRNLYYAAGNSIREKRFSLDVYNQINQIRKECELRATIEMQKNIFFLEEENQFFYELGQTLSTIATKLDNWLSSLLENMRIGRTLGLFDYFPRIFWNTRSRMVGNWEWNLQNKFFCSSPQNFMKQKKGLDMIPYPYMDDTYISGISSHLSQDASFLPKIPITKKMLSEHWDKQKNWYEQIQSAIPKEIHEKIKIIVDSMSRQEKKIKILMKHYTPTEVSRMMTDVGYQIIEKKNCQENWMASYVADIDQIVASSDEKSSHDLIIVEAKKASQISVEERKKRHQEKIEENIRCLKKKVREQEQEKMQEHKTKFLH